VFLKGLNDDFQFHLLNTDYENFQKLVDKAIIVESKLKELEKDGKRKMPFCNTPVLTNRTEASVRVPRKLNHTYIDSSW
jgi:hypothetical protein